jgi:MinD-like ATPase involved in chromosome partitioning or flagellar assembly
VKEVKNMTVGTQMTQAIATVQNAAATMKTFSLETQDQQAKQTFQQLAATLDDAVEKLQKREKYVQKQEPQYKQQ